MSNSSKILQNILTMTGDSIYSHARATHTNTHTHARTHTHCWEKIVPFRQAYCFLTFLPANSFYLTLLLRAPMNTIILQSCSSTSTTPLLQKRKHQFPTTVTSLVEAHHIDNFSLSEIRNNPPLSQTD
jgi:hypothetical protein